MSKLFAKIYNAAGGCVAKIPVRMFKTHNGWTPSIRNPEKYDPELMREFETPPSIGGQYYVLKSKTSTNGRDDAVRGEDFARYGVVDHYGQPVNRWNGTTGGYLFDHIDVVDCVYRQHRLGSFVNLVDGILSDFEIPEKPGHYIFNDGSTVLLRQEYISANEQESMAGMVVDLFLTKQGEFEQEYQTGYGTYEFRYSN